MICINFFLNNCHGSPEILVEGLARVPAEMPRRINPDCRLRPFAQPEFLPYQYILECHLAQAPSAAGTGDSGSVRDARGDASADMKPAENAGAWGRMPAHGRTVGCANHGRRFRMKVDHATDRLSRMEPAAPRTVHRTVPDGAGRVCGLVLFSRRCPALAALHANWWRTRRRDWTFRPEWRNVPPV